MKDLNKNQKIIISLIAIIIIVIVIYFFNKKDNNTYENYIVEDKSEFQKEEKNIIVHVIGEVKKNGIVEVKENSRISDIIEAAGGTTEKADLSKVNLAYIVEDGQKIYIPSVNDENTKEYVTSETDENIIINENHKNKTVNINTATQTELETLTGIGPSTALKIINYREEKGKFKKKEDLMNVPGIGESKFDVIKDIICIK